MHVPHHQSSRHRPGPASCILGGWALRVGDAAEVEVDGGGAWAGVDHQTSDFKGFYGSKTLNFCWPTTLCYRTLNLILEKSTVNQWIDWWGKSTETMSSPPKIWGVCCKFSLQASLRHKLLKSVSSRRKSMEVRNALRICRCLGCAEGPAKKSCPKPMPDQVPCAKRDSCFHPPSFLL